MTSHLDNDILMTRSREGDEVAKARDAGFQLPKPCARVARYERIRHAVNSLPERCVRASIFSAIENWEFVLKDTYQGERGKLRVRVHDALRYLGHLVLVPEVKRIKPLSFRLGTNALGTRVRRSLCPLLSRVRPRFTSVDTGWHV